MKSSSWCALLWVYLFVALICLLGYLGSSHSFGSIITYILVTLLVIVVICWVIRFLCKRGEDWWATMIMVIALALEIAWIVVVCTIEW